MTTQVISRTGKTVVLTNTGAGVTAAIPAMMISLGYVGLTDAGLQAALAQTIGGKLVRVEIQLDSANMRIARAIFAEAAIDVAAHNAAENDYDAHYNAVIDKMTGN